jgi:hypothetical protein
VLSSLSNHCWRRRFLFCQGQDSGSQDLHRLPLSVVERLDVEGIHQGEHLAVVGRRSRILAALEATLDLGHGPVVVGGEEAVAQGGTAQGGVDLLAARARPDSSEEMACTVRTGALALTSKVGWK